MGEKGGGSRRSGGWENCEWDVKEVNKNKNKHGQYESMDWGLKMNKKEKVYLAAS